MLCRGLAFGVFFVFRTPSWAVRLCSLAFDVYHACATGFLFSSLCLSSVFSLSLDFFCVTPQTVLLREVVYFGFRFMFAF